ncbi:MAG: sensor histidine kinase [Asticcacaulis sp.]|nr:sensor histidine kinase [Asticcacaulis sp.]
MTLLQWIGKLFSRLIHSRNSLVGRLIRLAAVWFIFSLVITGLALTMFFHEAALQRFQVNVYQISDNLLAGTNLEPDGSVTPPLSDAQTTFIYSGLYWEVSEVVNGQLVVRDSSRSVRHVTLTIPPETRDDLQKKPGDPLFFNEIGPQRQYLRVAAIFSVIEHRNFVFLAGEDRTPMDKDVRTFGLVTALALLILAIGSLLSIFFQVRIGLRPLFDLTGEIAGIQRGEQQRIVKTYPAEITPVARQINAFLDDAQEMMERQRMHVGNLAHALKTPLSVLLTAAGDADGPLPETVRKQTETMRGQVDHHLRRARAAARAQTLGERTPVEPVLDELAVMLEQVFHDKGVIIDWRAPDGLSFRGERQDFQEIAGNLLENACIWCKRRVRITAEFIEDEQVLSVAIEDDGPGLDESRFEEVLKRGARLDESVPGTGLGLSIVDELVRAYGGQLRFERAALGGLKVKIRLPGMMEKAGS